jgi:cytoskeletal protein RodZ
MPPAGELLRTEREKRNRTLSDLANATRISVRYLQAIEAGDTGILPGDFFHRSFIRQYASALGLPDDETKYILASVAPAPEIDPLPALSQAQKIADAEHRQKPLAQVPAGAAATLLVVVLTVCSGLYALWNRAQESSEPGSPERASAAVVEPFDNVDDAEPPATNPNQSTGTAGSTVAEPGKITVDLAATEETWVSLSSAGQVIFSGILDAEQMKNFALHDDARLLTGNAAGLDVRMNGQPIGPLGSRGQVRVVLFTHDNYQILSPRKM